MKKLPSCSVPIMALERLAKPPGIYSPCRFESCTLRGVQIMLSDDADSLCFERKSLGKPTGLKNWRACVSHAKDHCCNDAYDSISGNAMDKYPGIVGFDTPP